jgi:transposase
VDLAREPLRRVDRAFQAFFRRVKVGQKPGYPRFRSPDRYHSLALSAPGFRIEGNLLFISKLGDRFWTRPGEFSGKQLTYKAAEAGKWAILVDLRLTTQTCSGCGQVRNKPLSERVHQCNCGLVMSRDQNAAINILRLGRVGAVGTSPKSPSRYENRTLPLYF